jgi:hypothetical protein
MATLIKTPCASATLAYFGVTGTTWNERTQRNVWDDTLRRNGYAVRSRASKLSRKESTVGAARGKLASVAAAEPEILAFVARVDGHVLVIDRNGETVVDTDPRKRDKRKLRGVFAVMRK